MGKKIKLYHGSIHKFDDIDVSKGKLYKDFGAGFYLSPSENHSVNLALRSRDIELMRLARRNKKSKVNAWIYVYEFDSECLKKLKTKNFSKADAEWMKFIISNRSNSKPQHKYDIVTGPAADDNIRVSIQAFLAGVYGDTSSDDAVNVLVSMMESPKLPVQYCFGSAKAASTLVFLDRVSIE